MMDVLKFIELVMEYRKTRVIDPDKAEKLGTKIDKACNEYYATGFIGDSKK